MLAQLVLSDFNLRKICAQIYLALHFPSNDSRYSMLATLFLFEVISDIKCYIKIQPTFNVSSYFFEVIADIKFYLRLQPTFNVNYSVTVGIYI